MSSSGPFGCRALALSAVALALVSGGGRGWGRTAPGEGRWGPSGAGGYRTQDQARMASTAPAKSLAWARRPWMSMTQPMVGLY